jgi:hypothetical protein
VGRSILLEHCLGWRGEGFPNQSWLLLRFGNSPDAKQVVLVEDLIVAHNGDIFRLRLGDEHAVERIFVFTG